MKCPNCGAETNSAVCEYCGTQINNPHGCCKRCGSPNLSFRRENQGEVKGKKSKEIVHKTVGICKDCGYTWFEEEKPAKKRKTWLWVLGWIFIFPLPLTILIARSKKIKLWAKILIIAAAWGSCLLVGCIRGGEAGNTDPDQQRTAIQELSFYDTEDITVRIGQKNSKFNHLSVTTSSRKDLDPNDIIWYSENPTVATISFTEEGLGNHLYFEITGISAGETAVYAISKDNKVESEHIRVTVPKPIEVESIRLIPEKTELCLNESTKANMEILPENAEDRAVVWRSSNEEIAIVDDKGSIQAVGDGTAIITVESKNHVMASFEITVDGTKTLMKLNIKRERDDDINIGDEWSYVNEINGEKATNSYALSIGDRLSIHSKYTELDDNPDVGEASITYEVKEEDIINGFSVSFDVYVKENGGKNSGKKAHFIVTYSFTPITK